MSSRTIQPFNPAQSPDGSQFDTTLGGNYGYFVFFNLSPYELELKLSNGDTRAAPAWWARLLVFDQEPCPTIFWTIKATPDSSNPPLSMCWGEAYDISDDIAETYPQVLVRQTNIGNAQVAVSSSSSVVNDGNAAGTVVVEGTPSGTAVSQLKLTNDGQAVLGGGHITIDGAGVVAGASIAASEISGTLPAGQVGTGYPAANLGTGTLPAGVSVPAGNVSGKVASASAADSVPASGVSAGTLGAGVTVPAANVSGKVASASAADSATDATVLQASDGVHGIKTVWDSTNGRIDIEQAGAGAVPVQTAITYQDSSGIQRIGILIGTDGTLKAGPNAANQLMDTNGDVPLATLAAGALPAGITIPGGQVSSAVANATNATNAASATSATNNQDGNPAIGAKSAGGGTAGRTNWYGTTDPGASAAEGDSWDAV